MQCVIDGSDRSVGLNRRRQLREASAQVPPSVQQCDGCCHRPTAKARVRIRNDAGHDSWTMSLNVTFVLALSSSAFLRVLESRFAQRTASALPVHILSPDSVRSWSSICSWPSSGCSTPQRVIFITCHVLSSSAERNAADRQRGDVPGGACRARPGAPAPLPCGGLPRQAVDWGGLFPAMTCDFATGGVLRGAPMSPHLRRWQALGPATARHRTLRGRQPRARQSARAPGRVHY